MSDKRRLWRWSAKGAGVQGVDEVAGVEGTRAGGGKVVWNTGVGSAQEGRVVILEKVWVG